MEKQIKALWELATEHLQRAYTPYSNFKVACVLKTKEGKIFTGVNIENSSYGLSMCAERVCLFNYVNADTRKDPIEMLLVTGNTPDAISPCGACRQVMSEFLSKETRIILTNVSGQVKEYNLEGILPYYFDKEDLTNGRNK